MSVLILSQEAFSAIASAILKASTTDEATEWLNPAASFHFGGEWGNFEPIEKWTRKAIYLNEESYSYRYAEKRPLSLCNVMPVKIVLDLNATQIMKYCDALQYNIELSTIAEHRELTADDKDVFKFLVDFRDDLARSIVRRSTEYDTALWS